MNCSTIRIVSVGSLQVLLHHEPRRLVGEVDRLNHQGLFLPVPDRLAKPLSDGAAWTTAGRTDTRRFRRTEWHIPPPAESVNLSGTQTNLDEVERSHGESGGGWNGVCQNRWCETDQRGPWTRGEVT